MEYERAPCCLSIPCPGAYPVTVLIAILPVPSLVSKVIEYLVFQHPGILAQFESGLAGARDDRLQRSQFVPASVERASHLCDQTQKGRWFETSKLRSMEMFKHTARLTGWYR